MLPLWYVSTRRAEAVEYLRDITQSSRPRARQCQQTAPRGIVRQRNRLVDENTPSLRLTSFSIAKVSTALNELRATPVAVAAKVSLKLFFHRLKIVGEEIPEGAARGQNRQID